MSTVTAPTSVPTSAPANRIGRIVRLHLVNPEVFLGIPWIIIGTAFAISLAIAGILMANGVTDTDGARYSWAVLSPQWYLVVVGVQAVGLTFQFALGFGATRRDFWLGTSLTFILVALFNAVAFTILVQIEKATGGWWLGAHMFDALWYGTGPWILDFFTTFVLQLAVLFIGASVTTVYMRWRVRGMLVVTIAVVALLLLSAVIISMAGAWPSVWAWFGTLTVATTFAWILVVTAVVAVLGYLVIAKATPR